MIAIVRAEVFGRVLCGMMGLTPLAVLYPVIEATLCDPQQFCKARQMSLTIGGILSFVTIYVLSKRQTRWLAIPWLLYSGLILPSIVWMFSYRMVERICFGLGVVVGTVLLMVAILTYRPPVAPPLLPN